MGSVRTKISSSGSSFCGMLTILFIALKLIGHIEWSWFWVLSPLWIPFCFIFGIIGLVVVIVALAFGCYCLFNLYKGMKRKKVAERIVRAREEAVNATAHGLGLDSDRGDVDNLLVNLRNRD